MGKPRPRMLARHRRRTGPYYFEVLFFFQMKRGITKYPIKIANRVIFFMNRISRFITSFQNEIGDHKSAPAKPITRIMIGKVTDQSNVNNIFPSIFTNHFLFLGKISSHRHEPQENIQFL
jgi:hypothetical protein